MKIFFNANQSNPNFNGYGKYYLDYTLRPYIESNTPIKIIEAETKISRTTIAGWIKKTYNMTATEFYRTKRNEYRKKIIIEMLTKGQTLQQIADELNVSISVIYKLIKTSDIAEHSKEILQKQALIEEMVKSGCTINQICKKTNFSTLKVRTIIKKIFNDSIYNVRKSQNIQQNKKLTWKEQEIKETIEDLYINQRLKKKDIAKVMNLRPDELYNLMRKFNIQSTGTIIKNILKENLYKYIQQGMTEVKICQSLWNIGIKTFTKYLQEIFGKNFSQIKKEVQLKNLKKQ